jgi:serine/threonine-protein kinase
MPLVGIAVGDVVGGKYRVDRVIGAGGMGLVVAAHHLELDETVALKFLLPEALRNPEAEARFVREARAAVKIKNEHVARVIDVGRLDGGPPYIVMEYLEGADLSAWLRRRGPLPIPQAVDFVLQACEAIAEAHAMGLVHRDLKPANLFCIQRSDGQLCVKVLDFGISKITSPGAARHEMTASNAFMGSPLYTSPEQMLLSKGVDARTDIWSLGVILFELLTGRVPFEAELVTELAIKVANQPAPLLRSILRQAPAGLEQVVATCLAKDRNARFPTVGDLAVALRDFAPKHALASVDRVLGTMRQAGLSGGGAPPSGDPQSGPAFPVTPLGPQTGASWGTTGQRSKTSARVVAALAVAMTLGVLALAGTLWAWRAQSSLGAATAPPLAASATASALLTPEPPDAVASPRAPASSLPETPIPSAAVVRPVARPPAQSVRAASTPSIVLPGPAPAVSALPTTGCDPPFYFDPKGARVFKKECL